LPTRRVYPRGIVVDGLDSSVGCTESIFIDINIVFDEYTFVVPHVHGVFAGFDYNTSP
jgi:hypothetical protein